MPSSPSYHRLPLSSPPSSPPSAFRPLPPPTSPSSLPLKIDLKSIDAGFSKWIRTVRHKSKVRKRTRSKLAESVRAGKLELMESVFGKGGKADPSHRYISSLSLSNVKFQESVEAVKAAISEGVHPKMISKGSSGSYFARDQEGVVVGVFKPKDEEPYGRLNPKWTKWIHRTFFSWVGFGRACLIPNLSYICEAATSRLDERLGLGIVPKTELVSLSSPSFFYEWIQRNAYARNKKPLPDKIGSLQTFCAGFKDASDWLHEHPWPGLMHEDEHKSRTKHVRRCLRAGAMVCGRAGADEWSEDEVDEGETAGVDGIEGHQRFRWTAQLKADFRLELEKLIMLDWLMRNTDRGLDNFMIKFVPAVSGSTSNSTPIIYTAPSSTASPSLALPSLHRSLASLTTSSPTNLNQQRTQKSGDTISIAAIDNSLSFPHHHPKGWRSYPYGWLYLPVSLIGQPFSDSIRSHMVPLLSSPPWWEKTISELRLLFELDEDFSEAMFAKQMSVLKGQGASLLESLKHADEGPLELCRRDLLLVLTEPLEVPDSVETASWIAETMAQHPLPPPPPSSSPKALLPSITSPTSPTFSLTSTSSAPPPPSSLRHAHSFTAISSTSPRASSSSSSARPVFPRSNSSGSQPPSVRSHSRTFSIPLPVSSNASPFANSRPAPVGPRLLSVTPNAKGVDVLRAMEKVDNAERTLLKLEDCTRFCRHAEGDTAPYEEGDEENEDDDSGFPSRSAFSDGEEQQPSRRQHRGREGHQQSTRSASASRRTMSNSFSHGGSGAKGSLNAIFEAEDQGRLQEGRGEELGSPDEQGREEEGTLGLGLGRGRDRWGSGLSGDVEEEDGEGDENEGTKLLGDEEQGEGRTRIVLIERIKKVKGDAWFAF